MCRFSNDDRLAIRGQRKNSDSGSRAWPVHHTSNYVICHTAASKPCVADLAKPGAGVLGAE